MNISETRVWAALLAALTFSAAALAQEEQEQQAPTRPEWVHVEVIKIDPEKVDEWMELEKSQVGPAFKKAGIPWRSAWQSGLFGEAFTYVFATPIENFAQFDGQHPVRQALGAEKSQEVYNQYVQCLESASSLASIVRSDLGYYPDAGYQPKLAVVQTLQVARGREADFEELMKNEFTPAIKKAGIPGYIVHQTVFGGPGGEFVALAFIDNYAEVDKGPPAMRVLGPEGAEKLYKKLSEVVASSRIEFARFVPSLSYFPEPPGSK